jgi:nicotinate phosphoribosyltransferase
VLEFGLRRAHGPDGGVSGSRACYVGGCASTSNVLAGKIYGIPVSGTHAHSWVMSFESELEAFRAFARHYPEKCVLLVDTYDTLESGVPNAIQVFKEMREAGHDIRPAIRLDSGDLAKLSKQAHGMLVEAGLTDPLIVASNDLEEDLIADLKRQGAKINAWGVGTHLITARDCPSLSGVYKLVSVWDGQDWLPRMKTTSNIGKSTDPGRKQVVRYYGEDGAPLGDVLYVQGDAYEVCGDITGHLRIHHHLHRRLRGAVDARPLLETVFENGRRTQACPDLSSIRQKAQEQIARLPDEYKRLRNPEIYKVLLSERVAHMKTKFIEDQDG